ncbi:MAG: sn-glycerol-3-phosphate ABC transporter ATP-binding protein UgpC [Defluviitaleaceae bacterium]|nr:sn-glycerol-3-phosphate ABC transporter ATP-binding protein UgpC [Defluviitaleaceae bacterium]
MPQVSLRNIYKMYPNAKNSAPAVQDFNLEVEDGEFIVLVGPSGCGKSTTLRMIAGLESISKGEIYIDGKLINNLPPKDRDIAMVFQNYALYPNLSNFENMAFGLRLRKVEKYKINELVNAKARELEIDNLLERQPKDVSGGQRQRVALGRAIVREPKVFLMDEPLSNLDAKMRVQMRVEIMKLHQKLQATTIYVTHDQIEAMTMGHRIVIMNGGIVQQVATPEEIYNKPANRFIGSFIGSPPMNFIFGRLEAGSGGQLYFSNSHMYLPFPRERVTKEIEKYIDADIVGGIRPEALSLRGSISTERKPNEFYAEVDVSELVGADRYVYLNINQRNRETLVARVPAKERYESGSRVIGRADMEFFHLFDVNTEQRIE